MKSRPKIYKRKEELLRKLKRMEYEKKRKLMIHYAREAEKVSKSELPIAKFDPISTIKAQKNFQNILAESLDIKIDDINVLLKGAFWDSAAYGLRANWLLEILKSFKSSLGSKFLPNTLDALEDIAASFFKYHTVNLEPSIKNLDLVKGEEYLEMKKINLAKLDVDKIEVEEKIIEVEGLVTDNMENLLKITFDKVKELVDEKNYLRWDIFFPTSLDLSDRLTRALHLSYLTFQDKLYYTGNGFQLKEGNTDEN